MLKDYNGVYDKRLVGMYKGKIVYYDKEDGYVIDGLYPRKPSLTELEDIKKLFGNLEKIIDGGENK